MALQPAEVDGDIGFQFDAHDIVIAAIRCRRPAGLYGCDVARSLNDRFREQESRGKLVVIAWRAHCDRNTARSPAVSRRVAQPDLERFLNRYVVGMRLLQTATDLADIDCVTAASHVNNATTCRVRQYIVAP